MTTHTGDGRGQSSIVGYALIVGFTLAMASSIVVIGAVTVADTRNAAQAGQAEQAMSQLAARGSLVALGDAGAQRLRLSDTSQGSAAVDADAGHIEVLWFNGTATETLVDVPLGRVEYDLGDTAVAYQAGGVWRRDEGGSTMVSPPQYHYRERTLTFPIVQVAGDWAGSPTRRLAVAREGTSREFPTASDGNPLRDGHVHVRVTSDYHRGWASFFETRTEGTVSHDPENRTATVNLTVPFTAEFDKAVVATEDGSDAIDHQGSHHGGFGSPQEVGAERPSASPKVEAEIDGCEGGNCTDLDEGLDDGVLENGTYYADGDVDIGETTYNTSSGDIDVVVDGDLEFVGSGGKGNGGEDSPNHEITGQGRVTFYLNGSLTVRGNTEVNTGGQPSQLVVLMHSDGGEISTAKGTPQFTGFIYAPNASLSIKGGGGPKVDNIVGGVVVKSAEATGTGKLVYGDPGDIAIEFSPIDTINYLHVTTNKIEVRAD